ncbi:MAG: hypothetical protein RXR20_22120 [Paraburkholderia sp.]|jgi:hypothetical protein|uniref:hypothetical protein n=1 Tax=Burkholderiaceae TaxID=119060 RepID=UPI0010F92C0F|nr:hypothetical protein [Burkholderia sp. 4M9327F10]
MKLSDFNRPSPCATAAGAAALAAISCAHADARPASLKLAPNVEVALLGLPTIHFTAPRETATYAFTVQ